MAAMAGQPATEPPDPSSEVADYPVSKPDVLNT